IFVATLGEDAARQGFLLVQQVRSTGIEAELDYTRASLKSQMRHADKVNARYVLILGENDLREGAAQLRDMATKEQSSVPLAHALQAVKEVCGRTKTCVDH
ncbi:MAG: His/Gly/Thr/Pro-type tRNA ligase C-terminal domain-containing protein, partial [Desulforhabdus sp.]|nr:His/Gly/Thr/Pro-type tRNA ligase C-terminal domain-containing protein [Desulforhabdus sp.]